MISETDILLQPKPRYVIQGKISINKFLEDHYNVEKQSEAMCNNCGEKDNNGLITTESEISLHTNKQNKPG